MNIANKTFKDNLTGEIVKVIGTFENIAILENKQKMDVRNLTDDNKFTEVIDPASFLNNSYTELSNTIRNIPIEKLSFDEPMEISVERDDSFRPSMNESAIIETTDDFEKEQLAKKYGATIDNSDAIKRQNEAFSKLLDEDELPPARPVRTVEVNNTTSTPISPIRKEDPITEMFRKVKRNVDFNIDIKITDKIPRLDFIEMMEDSYSVSIIDFLADEFTDKIINDRASLKLLIKTEIERMVNQKNSKPPKDIESAVNDINTLSEIITKKPRRTTKK